MFLILLRCCKFSIEIWVIRQLLFNNIYMYIQSCLSPSLSHSPTWNPMLGLISGLRDDWATIPALYREFESLGLFVYILIITDLSAYSNERYEQLLLRAWGKATACSYYHDQGVSKFEAFWISLHIYSKLCPQFWNTHCTVSIVFAYIVILQSKEWVDQRNNSASANAKIREIQMKCHGLSPSEFSLHLGLLSSGVGTSVLRFSRSLKFDQFDEVTWDLSLSKGISSIQDLKHIHSSQNFVVSNKCEGRLLW